MSSKNGNGVAAVLPSRSVERPMTILYDVPERPEVAG
jgi:hypothetical protein